jgi:hypothetical protein
MDTVTLLILLAIVAAILYFMPTLDALIKKILYFILVVAVIAWLLALLGVIPAHGILEYRRS